MQKGYKILELDTYFTAGPEERREWSNGNGNRSVNATRIVIFRT